MHPRSLGQGIGEGLGEGRQGVDVDGIVEAVGVLHPAGKHVGTGGAALAGQILQHLPLLAVSGDDQADMLGPLAG